MNTLILLAWIGLASATPAIIWNKIADSSSPVHSSDIIDIPSLINPTFQSKSSESLLSSVIFLVGRNHDGSEALSRLSSSGALPSVEQRFEKATSVHYHLQGVESFWSFAQELRATATKDKVMEMSMEEYQKRMTTLGQSSSSPSESSSSSIAEITVDGDVQEQEMATRARALASATVLIVNVSPEAPASVLDSAVTAAIENEHIHSVILTAVRSLDEAKLVRNLMLKEKLSTLEESHHRRLKDQQQQQQYYSNTPNNVYYTSMTPNIFAAIMFFLFFIFIGYIGLGCMNQISGPDVYVQKYPVIGREA